MWCRVNKHYRYKARVFEPGGLYHLDELVIQAINNDEPGTLTRLPGMDAPEARAPDAPPNDRQMRVEEKRAEPEQGPAPEHKVVVGATKSGRKR
jgi:hypothetical protein